MDHCCQLFLELYRRSLLTNQQPRTRRILDISSHLLQIDDRLMLVTSGSFHSEYVRPTNKEISCFSPIDSFACEVIAKNE